MTIIEINKKVICISIERLYTKSPDGRTTYTLYMFGRWNTGIQKTKNSEYLKDGEGLNKVFTNEDQVVEFAMENLSKTFV